MRNLCQRLYFRHVQIGGFTMRFSTLSCSVSIVLGDHHIRLAGFCHLRCIFHVVSPMLAFVGIGPRRDQLRSGLPMSRPMHLVLHRGEKRLDVSAVSVVVNTGGVNVQHFSRRTCALTERISRIALAAPRSMFPSPARFRRSSSIAKPLTANS